MPPNFEQVFVAFIVGVPPALWPDGQAGSLHRDTCCSEPFPKNTLTNDAVAIDVIDR
jgi:hypothetical protein